MIDCQTANTSFSQTPPPQIGRRRRQQPVPAAQFAFPWVRAAWISVAQRRAAGSSRPPHLRSPKGMGAPAAPRPLSFGGQEAGDSTGLGLPATPRLLRHRAIGCSARLWRIGRNSPAGERSSIQAPTRSSDPREFRAAGKPRGACWWAGRAPHPRIGRAPFRSYLREVNSSTNASRTTWRRSSGSSPISASSSRSSSPLPTRRAGSASGAGCDPHPSGRGAVRRARSDCALAIVLCAIRKSQARKVDDPGIHRARAAQPGRFARLHHSPLWWSPSW